MRPSWVATLALLATPVLAQDPATATADPQATTLETMIVRPEPEEVVDLYRFRNPVDVEAGTFDRSWKEPVQAAVARPPPRDDEQQARALRLYDAGEPSR